MTSFEPNHGTRGGVLEESELWQKRKKKRRLHCLLTVKWECEHVDRVLHCWIERCYQGQRHPWHIRYACGCGKQGVKIFLCLTWVSILLTHLFCAPHTGQPASRPAGQLPYTQTHNGQTTCLLLKAEHKKKTNIGMLVKGWCTAYVCPHHQPSIEIGQERVNWPC